MSTLRLTAALILIAACQNTPTPAPESKGMLASPDLTAMPGEPRGQELPPGHPPVGPKGMPAGHPPTGEQALPPGHPSVAAGEAGAAPSGPAQAGGLTWKDAAPLVRHAPKSQMRAAEYGIEGDAQAELSVFYFGPGAAGGIDANITRWLGQFSQADGSDGASKAKRSTRKVGTVAVDTVEVTGKFGGGMGGVAGSGDDMLLGAIATGPQGAVFFKLTGPRGSVEKARGAFDSLIGSLQPVAP